MTALCDECDNKIRVLATDNANKRFLNEKEAGKAKIVSTSSS